MIMTVCTSECLSILSPAQRMRSAAQVSCVFGASVQLMPLREQKEQSVRARTTANETSAVHSNEVTSFLSHFLED